MAVAGDGAFRVFVMAIAARLAVALPIFAWGPAANGQPGAPLTTDPNVAPTLSPPPAPPAASMVAAHIPAGRDGLPGTPVVPGSASGVPCPQVIPPPNVDFAEWQRQQCLRPGPCSACPDQRPTTR